MVMVDISRLGMRLYMGGTGQVRNRVYTATVLCRPSLGLGGDSAIGHCA